MDKRDHLAWRLLHPETVGRRPRAGRQMPLAPLFAATNGTGDSPAGPDTTLCSPGRSLGPAPGPLSDSAKAARRRPVTPTPYADRLDQLWAAVLSDVASGRMPPRHRQGSPAGFESLDQRWRRGRADTGRRLLSLVSDATAGQPAASASARRPASRRGSD